MEAQVVVSAAASHVAYAALAEALLAVVCMPIAGEMGAIWFDPTHSTTGMMAMSEQHQPAITSGTPTYKSMSLSWIVLS